MVMKSGDRYWGKAQAQAYIPLRNISLITESPNKIVAHANYCFNCFVTNVTMIHDVNVTSFFVYSFIDYGESLLI